MFCEAPATTAAPKAAAPSYESAGAGAGRETRTVTAPPAGGKLIHPEEDVSLVGAVYVSWLQSWFVPVKSYSIKYLSSHLGLGCSVRKFSFRNRLICRRMSKVLAQSWLNP